MKIVDTKGQACPAPLVATRRALKEAGEGTVLKILTDSQTSLNNISRFLKDNGIGFSVKNEGENSWSVELVKSGDKPVTEVREDSCPVEVPYFSKGDFVVSFASDLMGQGDDELGRFLINSYIRSLKDLDLLPSCMVFYNRGVFLGADDSPVAKDLAELEAMGIELFFCATCVGFYKLEGKIKTGTMSNMYEISSKMASAGNIVKP